MKNSLYPGAKIGLIGSGYYTEELARAFENSGYVVKILSDKKLQLEQVEQLASEVERAVCTVEKIDVELLEPLGDKLLQDPALLLMTQDRLLFKNFLDEKNINTQPYTTIFSEEDIYQAVDSLGFPLVLRSNQNVAEPIFIHEEAEISEAFAKLVPGPAVLEAWVPIDTEIAMTVSRSGNGKIRVLSKLEVIRRGGQISQYLTNPRMNEEWDAACQEVAEKFSNGIKGEEVFTLELLITSAGVIYLHNVKTKADLIHYPQNIYGRMIPLVEQVRLTVGKRWKGLTYKPATDFVILPILYRQIDEALKMVADHPEWDLSFIQRDWQQAEPQEKVAELMIATEHVQETLAAISNYKLYS